MTAYTWTGGAGADTSWTNPLNWSGNGTPNVGYPGGPNGSNGTATNDTVTFAGGGTINVTAPPSTFRMSGVQINGATTVNLNGPGEISTFSVGGSGGYNLVVNGSTVTNNVGSTPTDPLGQGPNGVNLTGSGGTLTLENGGKYFAYNNNGLSTVNFGTGGGDFIWVGGGNTGGWSQTAITGFNADSHFINGPISANAYANDSFSATATLNGTGPSYTVVVKDTTTNTVVITYPSVTPAPGFDMNNLTATPSIDQFNNNTNYYAVDLSCFLQGTHILTASGEVAVEMLEAGDMVTAVVNGVPVQKRVKWVGHRSIKAGKLPHDEDYPIRVRAGAFANNVPHRDLLITGEHCVLVDGRLVPVRMLVNGRSIIIDRSIENYTYYHVELEQHAIVLAEGLPAESYLDTGNRGLFANSDTPLLHPNLSVNADHKNWATHAAAPLAVDATFVEPIWRALEQRAMMRGIASVVAPPVLTDDADLHLRTGSGQQIRPVRVEGGRHSYMVPAGTKMLRVVSHSSRPADIRGPFVDDRRSLGVKVSKITVQGTNNLSPVAADLAAATLDGWHAPEPDGRWTNGDAVLPLGSGYGPMLVEIQVVAGGPYLSRARVSDEIQVRVA